MTPMIVTNLNLPPEIRYRNENILLCLLIPGPKKHGLLDTFLYPFVEEMKALDAGIPNIYNSYTDSSFSLHAWLLFVSGDGPASAEAMGMATPGNAINPCHQCQIKATKGPGNHYYPCHRPEDFVQLKPRQNLGAMIDLWDTHHTAVGKTKLTRLYGITRKSILLELSSLHFPRSFPLDPMHCILLNIAPRIVEYWGGKWLQQERQLAKKIQKAVASNTSTAIATPEQPFYVISDKKIWREIGNIQEGSRASIPQLLGQGPRRIDKHIAGYKAKEWEALLIRDGPILFAGIPELAPYLDNFKILGRIHTAAKAWSISQEDLHRIEVDCTLFVKTHEMLYYGGKEDRLKTCLTNNHSLLHLGKSVVAIFPPAAYKD